MFKALVRFNTRQNLLIKNKLLTTKTTYSTALQQQLNIQRLYFNKQSILFQKTLSNWPLFKKNLQLNSNFLLLSNRNHSSLTNNSSNNKMSSKTEFQRLPLNVLPTNYAVTLRPDLTNFTFDGQVVVDVDIKQETTTILLNSAELKFDRATLTFNNTNRSLTSSNVTLNADSEVATIEFPEALNVGQAKLCINYTGILNENLKGFYKSKYVHPSGETRYAAVTQFEAADARRALPCWDEPAHKATFDVTIIAEPGKTVLSNMPVINESEVTIDGKSFKKYAFDRTPKMSTYLLAFVVGEYDYIEEKDKNGCLIRVYTPLGKKHFGKFALEVSLKTLPFYTEYFGIGYPLPKLDLIAIADFAAGAMENWGLVTYRETALLIDPDNSSLQSKQRVAIVVGHEIAHQWFGNLVTMEWWTHLWLNEGFASWIEYLCVDHCLPEFDIWTDFVSSDLCRALELDGLKNSHPIEVPVGPPSEVDEIFDAISYSKGGSVIRMLHSYIGDDAFRKGLHNYLEKYKYSNAVTEELWEKLSEASQKPVGELMALWTGQTGYPVLNVSKRIDANNHTIIKISQERFFSNGDKPTNEENYLWKVPITIITKSSYPNVHQNYLLEKREDEIDLGVLNAGDWVKLNKNTVGFYRTNYSNEMLEELIDLIKNQSVHPTDRLGLQNDAFALSQAGRLSTAEVLKFAQAYVVEDNVVVWRDLLTNLLKVMGILLSTDFHGHFKTYIRELIKPISKKLGWDPLPGESNLQSMCRATILKVLGLCGDDEIIQEAKNRLEKHLKGDLIPADLRSAVYSSVLVNADEATLNKFIEMHDSCDLQEEKMRIALSLGCVSNRDLIQKVLQFAISPSVRSQDSVSVICGVAGSTTSSEAGELSWQFVKDNWKLLYSRYSSGFLITRLVKCTTEGFTTEERAREVEEYFKQNPTPGAARTIQQSIESIHGNARWLNREKSSLRDYLIKF